jgi:4-nitrophenyl phosphatase
MKPHLQKKKLFIFDLDGVIYRGNRPIPSAVKALKRLREQKKEIVFLTNNSSKSSEMVASKLHQMEIQVTPSQIFTSGLITAINLSQQYPQARVYCVGGEGLYETMFDYGFDILNRTWPDLEISPSIPEDIKADLVVVGWDPAVTYGKLRTAMMLVLHGAHFYATNDDASFPAPGTLWPGAGANVAFLSTALEQPPRKIFGKPHSDGILEILKNYHVEPTDAVMIGDRLTTDILGGNNAGIETVLVETGVHTRADVQKYPDETHPTYIYPDLIQMLDA